MKKESRVVIPLSEYRTLIQAFERMCAVKRFIENQKFTTIDDIRALLDIEKELKNDVYYRQPDSGF